MMPRVRVKWLIRRIAALGLAMALFGIVQRGTFNGKLYWVWTPINTAGNAFGSFVNRNHFAGWMLMAAALTAGYRLLADGGARTAAAAVLAAADRRDVVERREPAVVRLAARSR